MKKLNKTGFTVIEILIAALVFTIVLLICLQGVTRLGQQYYKGVTSSQIQELNRQLVDDISQQIQFGSRLPSPISIPTAPPAGGSVVVFCVGDYRYRAVMNRTLDPPTVPTILLRQNNAMHCDLDPSIATFSGAIELAPRGSRILKLSVTHSGTLADDLVDSMMWNIDIRIALAADNELLESDVVAGIDTPAWYEEAYCRTGVPGSQFCATSRLQTTVLRRLRI